jgi:hypothetical protein
MESDNFDGSKPYFEISCLGYEIKGPSMNCVASFGAVYLRGFPVRLAWTTNKSFLSVLGYDMIEGYNITTSTR